MPRLMTIEVWHRSSPVLRAFVREEKARVPAMEPEFHRRVSPLPVQVIIGEIKCL